MGASGFFATLSVSSPPVPPATLATWEPAGTGQLATANQINQFLDSHSQTLMHQGTTQLSGGYVGYTTISLSAGGAAQWVDQPFLNESQTSLPRIDLVFSGPPGPVTTIASGSNNVTLPTGTVNVVSNLGFPSAGVISIATTSSAPQLVSYTGTSGSTQFTGCTGGIGTMTTGGAVNITASDMTLSLQTDALGLASTLNTVFDSSINLLSAVNASLETGLGQWNNETNVVVSQTTTQALDGTTALKMSSVAAGTMTTAAVGINGTTAIPVTPGLAYSASAWFRADTSLVRNCQMAIHWYNLDGSLNSTSVTGTNTTDDPAQWLQSSVTNITAPTGVAFATPQIIVQSTAAAGEIHYVDQIMFNQGTSVTWTIPSAIARDTAANWVPNQWAGLQVWIPSLSAQTPYTATVLSNTVNTLTMTGSWLPTLPSNGTQFVIYGTPSGTSLASTLIPFDFIPTGITTINGGATSLPAATITVASTSGFLPYGQILVTNTQGQPQLVNYTGITSTTFTGCQFGIGSMATGGTVVAARQLSVPLNATNLTPFTNYHLVLAGVTSTSNYPVVLAGQARNANAATAISAAGPWTITSDSLVFATFGGNTGPLRNTYEDYGIKWSEFEYDLGWGASGPPSHLREYTQGQRTLSVLGYTNGLLTSSTSTNSLSPPSWAAASSGTLTYAGQINQFLGTHTIQFMYEGTQLFTNHIAGNINANVFKDFYDTAAVTSLFGANTGAAAQWLDQPFTTPAGGTSITRIILFPVAAGTGKDTTIELRTDSSGSPTNTVLASVVLPADFTNKPLYTSSSNTTYGATSATDGSGTFQLLGGPAPGLSTLYSTLLVNGSNFAVVTSNPSGNVPTGAMTTTTWSPGTPTNGTVFTAYNILSIPLPVTGLTASTKYHIVIDGTTDTTNFPRFATTAQLTGAVLQTSSTGTGSWTTTTTKTLAFAVMAFSGGVAHPWSSSLRNTWEDGGTIITGGVTGGTAPARWTGIDYTTVNSDHFNGAPLYYREYTGSFRSNLAVTWSNVSSNLGFGSMTQIG